jgi:hypothetical protein
MANSESLREQGGEWRKAFAGFAAPKQNAGPQAGVSQIYTAT